VAEALTIAVALAGDSGRSGAADTFRAWRVAFLPGILRPDSSAPEYGRAGFRAYAHALEELLERVDGRGGAAGPAREGAEASGGAVVRGLRAGCGASAGPVP
jgi:hypothetical protein